MGAAIESDAENVAAVRSESSGLHRMAKLPRVADGIAAGRVPSEKRGSRTASAANCVQPFAIDTESESQDRSRMFQRRRDRFACRGVPDPGRLIFGGSDSAAVAAEMGRFDRRHSCKWFANELASHRIKQPGIAIFRHR